MAQQRITYPIDVALKLADDGFGVYYKTDQDFAAFDSIEDVPLVINGKPFFFRCRFMEVPEKAYELLREHNVPTDRGWLPIQPKYIGIGNDIIDCETGETTHV